jgi:hypothetical protein
MGLTGLTPRPRPLGGPIHADSPLARTVTHHRAPMPAHRPVRTATHNPAPAASSDRPNGQPPHTIVIMTSGAYAAAKY